MANIDVEDIKTRMSGQWHSYLMQFTPLVNKGHEWRGPCVLHGGNGPNLAIDPETGSWFCHSQCQRGGDTFSFVQELRGWSFADALEDVANFAHFESRSDPKTCNRQTQSNDSTKQASSFKTVVAEYTYTDENNKALFQVVRYDPKNFRQRRSDGRGGWINNMDGVRRVPFQLPEILAARQAGKAIYIVEGEKDVLALHDLGLLATCNSGGAGKWQDDFKRFFDNAVVYIIPDNDKPGRDHAYMVASSLTVIAKSVQVLQLPGLLDKGDVSDWLSSNIQAIAEMDRIIMHTPEFDPNAERQSEPIGVMSNITELASEWEPVVSYAALKLPAFPLEALPPAIRNYVAEVSASVQVPPELPAMLALSAIGAAGCQSCVTQVGGTHVEPLNLWTATVMPPGSRKSSVVQAMVLPIEEYEREQGELVKKEIEEATEQRKLDEVRMKQRREKAATSKGPSVPYDPADLTEIPIIPRFLVDDTTTQQLATLIAENGAMAIFSAEGGILDIIAGRYSKDKGTDMDLYLKGHAGESYRVDRKGRPPEYIPRVLLTMGLAVQPAVLTSLTSQPSFQGRGLLARFLYSQPESLVGTRLYQNRPIDAGARARYCAVIRCLMGFRPPVAGEGKRDWHNLRLTGDALDLWVKYANAIERRQAEGGDLAGVSEWASKLAGTVARIAGGFHLVENAQHQTPWSLPISQEMVAAAWAIGEEYLIPQALTAFEMMGMDPSENVAKRVLRWIERKRQTQFSWRDCHKDHSGLNPDKDLRPALRRLCERRYLREVVPSSARNEIPKVGRPKSEQYEVNPLWLTQAE